MCSFPHPSPFKTNVSILCSFHLKIHPRVPFVLGLCNLAMMCKSYLLDKLQCAFVILIYITKLFSMEIVQICIPCINIWEWFFPPQLCQQSGQLDLKNFLFDRLMMSQCNLLLVLFLVLLLASFKMLNSHLFIFSFWWTLSILCPFLNCTLDFFFIDL